MTKRIFRAISLVALAVLAATTSLILGALYPHFTNVQASQLREETVLAAHALANQGPSYFEGLEERFSSRITWIAADGSVLYDSRQDPGTMENHLAREEVQMALASGFGHSARYSDTLLDRYLYAAQRLPDGTVLRMSSQQSSVLNLVLGMSQFIVVGLAITVALSLYLASRLSWQITRPINALDLDDPMANSEYEEILPLLRRLDSQQRQLKAKNVELARKQKEFNTVTRSLSEGLVLLNTGGTILSINPAAARLLTVTPNCLGADFSAANRDPKIAELVEQALAGQKAEATVTLSSGEYLAAASPVRSEGAVFGVVLLLFDVTQQRKAEELRREFTANVSHELKTPLHAISGYAELMMGGLVPPGDMQDFSGRIYTEAQRMSQLVEDTLRLSRLDEGAAELQWTDTDLGELAREAIRSLSAPAERMQLTLNLTGTASLRGIPQLLSAIVFNLVSNAVKYNRPRGRVDITVSEAGDAVLLTVSDTGIGIPPEHQERIFERFYRVDKSRSQAVGGTGLGLSIVKHAARILHAQITLSSTPGEGTSVTVRFPRNAGDRSPS